MRSGCRFQWFQNKICAIYSSLYVYNESRLHFIQAPIFILLFKGLLCRTFISFKMTVFNREQLIAGAILGEVFIFFFSTLFIALKLCIMYAISYNKSCQNRFLKFTQCSAVLRICWVCWELPKFSRIIGYWLNIDSLSIHRFLVQKNLAN